ncbi:hypothetical protein KIPB_006487 [Kipferlia bialata]|uniref:Uncharacterized protein n=1 Tax=Kipferlia bialata TaxID=797122 RepID=A0A9K3D0C4_9EUKA|nr:hypothetical protein KIPB_006487 [Kipferlia bialata]|eukprot:g6487.t1
MSLVVVYCCRSVPYLSAPRLQLCHSQQTDSWSANSPAYVYDLVPLGGNAGARSFYHLELCVPGTQPDSHMPCLPFPQALISAKRQVSASPAPQGGNGGTPHGASEDAGGYPALSYRVLAHDSRVGGPVYVSPPSVHTLGRPSLSYVSPDNLGSPLPFLSSYLPSCLSVSVWQGVRDILLMVRGLSQAECGRVAREMEMQTADGLASWLGEGQGPTAISSAISSGRRIIAIALILRGQDVPALGTLLQAHTQGKGRGAVDNR